MKLCGRGTGDVRAVPHFHGPDPVAGGRQRGYLALRQDVSHHCVTVRTLCAYCQLLFQCHPGRGTLRHGHDGTTPGQSFQCGVGPHYDPGLRLGDRRRGHCHRHRQRGGRGLLHSLLPAGKIHPQHPSAGLSGRREGVHRSAGHRHPGLPGLLADERFPDRGQCPDDRLRRYGGGRHRRCHEGDHDDRHDLHWLWPGHPTADRILCGRGALGAAESIHALFSQTQRRLDTRWLLPASC